VAIPDASNCDDVATLNASLHHHHHHQTSTVHSARYDSRIAMVQHSGDAAIPSAVALTAINTLLLLLLLLSLF